MSRRCLTLSNGISACSDVHLPGASCQGRWRQKTGVCDRMVVGSRGGLVAGLRSAGARPAWPIGSRDRNRAVATALFIRFILLQVSDVSNCDQISKEIAASLGVGNGFVLFSRTALDWRRPLLVGFQTTDNESMNRYGCMSRSCAITLAGMAAGLRAMTAVVKTQIHREEVTVNGTGGLGNGR
jgi:hypothetical protein